MKIGQGYDVHRLKKGNSFILGGVQIPFEKGLVGHSDADVLLHAVTDAILGALGMGDIGTHFSDNDPNLKNADSMYFLRWVVQKVYENDYRIVNLDSTIICERPKLQKYIKDMNLNLSKELKVNINSVNVKAKTNEKLGYLGREEAIEAQAIILLSSK